MNYVAWNFGDFNNATRHLTRVERSVYRDAIEHYYDTEQPLNGVEFSRLAKRLLCSTDEEKQALKDVLSEFFVEKDGFYGHSRCDAEIAKYRANTSAKAKAGIASAAARQQKPTGVEQTLNTCATNQEPITNNQEPITKKKKAALTRPLEVDEQVWDDWLALRKAKKAPVTKTTVSEAEKQAALAGMALDDFLRAWCRRGSQGLEAAWLKPDERGQQTSTAIGNKPVKLMSPNELKAYQGQSAKEAYRMVFGDRPAPHGGDFIDVQTKELAYA